MAFVNPAAIVIAGAVDSHDLLRLYQPWRTQPLPAESGGDKSVT
jgi:hypothetical protein